MQYNNFHLQYVTHSYKYQRCQLLRNQMQTQLCLVCQPTGVFVGVKDPLNEVEGQSPCEFLLFGP